MSISVVGGASTQSRGRRPLPPGAISARTIATSGVSETVQFTYADGHAETRTLLSWTIGQSGLLWAAGPYPLEVRDAIKYELHQAQGSYGHQAEWALADALGAALDGVFTSDALSCRFFQDGGTALAAAARVARHATGKSYVVSCGYHGAAEEWAHEPARAGIPQGALANHYRFEWGDIAAVKSWSGACAAICVEVPPVPDDEARAFLQACRQACDTYGTILILDEVVTGFRLGLTGAAGRYGIKPDIATYGKAMSATGCVSAIVGRRDLVDLLAEPVFLSTTFGGSPGPCAVAAATVKWLTDNRNEVYGGEEIDDTLFGDGEVSIGYIHRIGKALQDGFNALGLRCVGQPERSVLQFDTDAEWLAFCAAMIERGVMVHRPQFPTLTHTETDVARSLEAAAEVMKVAA